MSAIAASLSFGAPSIARQGVDDTPDKSVFVEQAPQAESTNNPTRGPTEQPDGDQSSKVYFPDEITPEAVAIARSQAQAQEQGGEMAQVAQGEDRRRNVDQLSDGRSAEVLEQLTPAQREVLIDAVEGTDICDREQSIPALRALCENRLEDRSAEFAQRRAGATAADAILGESLGSERVATLEAAIARLARASAGTNGVDDSVVASVAFTNQNAPDNQDAVESNPGDDLSPETQAVVNSIVQQLGGP